jgi:hypothetical protein
MRKGNTLVDTFTRSPAAYTWGSSDDFCARIMASLADSSEIWARRNVRARVCGQTSISLSPELAELSAASGENNGPLAVVSVSDKVVQIKLPETYKHVHDKFNVIDVCPWFHSVCSLDVTILKCLPILA